MCTDLNIEANSKKICLIEPSSNLNRLYQSALSKSNYHVDIATSSKEALEVLSTTHCDLIIMELNLPDISGTDFIEILQQQYNDTPVLVISEQGSINTAVDIMRKGARDFLIKPFQPERLTVAVRKELEQQKEEQKQARSMRPSMAGIQPEEQHLENPAPLKHTKESKSPNFGSFIGTSPVMLSVYDKIEKAAQSDANIFITGQSGTGKEVCAEAIHKHSKRKDHPFIPVNCAAIPRDLIESELFGHVKGAFTGAISDREGAAKMADNGTLFLDEIAEMKPDMQTKLLRFVQTLCFQRIGSNKIEKTNIRIICATNRDPLLEIEQGRFREDLFYRLHVIPICMPPLHERGYDVLDIAKSQLVHYAALENKSFIDIDESAARILRKYHWPGNIRQLQNIIRHSVIMHDGPLLTADMLPGSMLHQGTNFIQGHTEIHENKRPRSIFHEDTAPMPQAANSLAAIEQKAIMDAIDKCDGNIPQAAAMLKISPSTIYRKKAEWKKSDENMWTKQKENVYQSAR